MSTSSIHPHRSLYLKEIEEGFEVLKDLEKDGFYNVPKITWWVLKYEELYQYAYAHRHVGSCIDGMGCVCCRDELESRFSWLYSGLEEVVQLYQHESYFKEEMAIFEQLKDDYHGLMQWLKKNEKLGTEDFLLFWIEWYEEEEETVRPFIIKWKNLDLNFEVEEWYYTVKFLNKFNEFYWTSNICSELD